MTQAEMWIVRTLAQGRNDLTCIAYEDASNPGVFEVRLRETEVSL